MKVDKFKKDLRKSGYSVAASAKGGFGGFSFGAGFSTKNEEEVEKQEETHSITTYYSQLKFLLLPMASCHLEGSLGLSENAINDLKELETLCEASSSENLVKKACDSFFQNYGSHVNIGQINFGGIYMWEIECSNQRNKSSETIKSSVSKATGGKLWNIWRQGRIVKSQYSRSLRRNA